MEDFITNPWISILVIPIAIFLISIWYNNMTKSKTRLSFVELKTIFLFDTFHEKFNSLIVKYDDKPINSNLIYFECCIINNGKIDIDNRMFTHPIEIVFPEKSEVLDCIIKTKSNEKIECTTSTQLNILNIEWNLLKPLESITFELIIKSHQKNQTYNLSSHIKINQRIKDIKKIPVLDIHNSDTKGKSKLYILFRTILSVGFSLLLSVVFAAVAIDEIQNYNKPKITYDTTPTLITNGKEVEIHYFDDSMYYLRYHNSDKVIAKIKPDSIDKHLLFKPTFEVGKRNYFLIIAGPIVSLVFLLGAWIFIKIAYEDVRLSNLHKKITTNR